jgi:hypothetical protein
VRYKTNYLRAFCSTDTNQSRVYYWGFTWG